MTNKKVLVLGVGNLLMGDEGVGVHAVHLLEQKSLPPEVHVVDGGTGGFHLLSYLQDYGTVIMIDATMDGKPSGTLSVLKPRFATDFPRSLSAHDIGLRDLIESAVLLSPLPNIYLLTVSVAELQPMSMQLTPAVAAVVPEVIARIQNILAAIMKNGEQPSWQMS